MNIGVIVPDRNDRPLFLDNCKRMIKSQTIEPFTTVFVDYPAKDDSCDIVPRIRKAYNVLSEFKSIDVIAIMENDDWYAPDYLEKMVEAWQRFEKPDLFGTCYTIYYHMQLRGYFTMEHHQRASLMNTLIKPGLSFEWPVDIEPYLDLHLWKTIPNRIVFRPERHLAIGMKHGIGKCGGESHVIDQRMIKRFSNPDNGFLKETLDPESFDFYWNFFNPKIESVTMNHPTNGSTTYYGNDKYTNNN